LHFPRGAATAAQVAASHLFASPVKLKLMQQFVMSLPLCFGVTAAGGFIVALGSSKYISFLSAIQFAGCSACKYLPPYYDNLLYLAGH